MASSPRLLLAGLSLRLFVFSSCLDGPGPGSVWDGSRWDSAGVEIVLNHGTPLRGESDRWAFSEALRIGVSDGEPEYMFGRLVGMGILFDDRRVVADRMARNLRFFLMVRYRHLPGPRGILSPGRRKEGEHSLTVQDPHRVHVARPPGRDRRCQGSRSQQYDGHGCEGGGVHRLHAVNQRFHDPGQSRG
jgi:hypothetical protein